MAQITNTTLAKDVKIGDTMSYGQDSAFSNVTVVGIKETKKMLIFTISAVYTNKETGKNEQVIEPPYKKAPHKIFGKDLK